MNQNDCQISSCRKNDYVLKWSGNIVGLVLLTLHTCRAHVEAVSFTTPRLSSVLSVSISFSHLDSGLFCVFLTQISKKLFTSCKLPKPIALSSLFYDVHDCSNWWIYNELRRKYFYVVLVSILTNLKAEYKKKSWLLLPLIKSHLNPLQQNVSSCTKKSVYIYCFEPMKTLITWVSKDASSF